VVEPERCTQAFECFYIGLEIGHGMGTGTEQVSPTASFPLDYDGTAYGVFAGYNVQNGSLVYGGELRFLHLDFEDTVSGFEVDSVIDLRARVGFAASDALLVYGAVGYSSAEAAAAGSFTMTGFNYGAGAEYNVSESFFVGVDLTGRDLEGSDGGFDYDGTVNTATLRVGFRF
jgi:opacity protein-like surface antigen